MKFLVAVIFFFITCQVSVAGEADIQVTDAWTRPVILENRPSAVYFTITNNNADDDKLIKAVSLLARRIEFHTHKHKDGVMKMVQVENIPVAANSTVKVEPGGYHLMVFGLSMKFAVGNEFPLVLTFEKAGRVTIIAKVMKKAP